MYEIGWKHLLKWFVGKFFSKEVADEAIDEDKGVNNG
jgi:hypothetical protein